MSSKRAYSKNINPYPKKRKTAGPLQEPTQPTSSEDNTRATRLPHRQMDALMLNTYFPLNSSHSKEAVIGVSTSDQSFKPELQLLRKSSTGHHGISLNFNEWKDLIQREDLINRYFDQTTNTSPKLKPFKVGDIGVSFQSIYGKETLVLLRNSSPDSENYSPDTIAIQQATWAGLCAAKHCITQAFTDATSSSQRAAAAFELLNNLVYDHLSSEVTNATKSDDEELSKLINDFFKDLDVHSLKGVNVRDHFVCHSLGLFCTKLFVNYFKMQSFYVTFSTETQVY